MYYSVCVFETTYQKFHTICMRHRTEFLFTKTLRQGGAHIKIKDPHLHNNVLLPAKYVCIYFVVAQV